MAKKSIVTRIPLELDNLIRKIAEKNQMTAAEAARELSREAGNILNGKVKRKKIIKEVRF